jgi:pimeloyl-ACP methyl ester carboxylesterase
VADLFQAAKRMAALTRRRMASASDPPAATLALLPSRLLQRSCFAAALLLVIAPCAAAHAQNSPPPQAANEHAELLFYRDAAGERRAVQTAADWKRRRAQIVDGMQQAMGKLPSRDALPDLDVRRSNPVTEGDVVRHEISFVAEAGDRVPAYLYVPANNTDGAERVRRPAMVALHQTANVGKGEVAGLGSSPNQAYGRELAQRGYVVIAPDYPSFGDYPYDFEADQYVSGTMKGIFNHMRAVDVLAARDDVDPDRIGVIGHSLGGHNSMFLAVFDERIRVTVTCCGWTPFHDYYGGKIEGWTSPRYMPRLKDTYGLDPDRVPFDFYEVVAAIAPRAFFSVSPERDSNFDVAGVRKAIPRAAAVYELLGVPENIEVRYPDCEHDFPPEMRQEAYRFIDRVLEHRPAER